MRLHLIRNLLLAALGVSTAASACAAEVALSGIRPDGGLTYAHVVSVRDAKFRHVVQQHTDYSCGAAALATILDYGYGAHDTEAQVIDAMMRVADPAQVKRHGFSLLDIKHYAEKLGYRTLAYRARAADLWKLNLPAIVLLDINGFHHFAVLRGADTRDAWLADPALGNRIMPLDQFQADWNGIVFAIQGRTPYETSTLAELEPPPEQRDIVGPRLPLHDARPIDFGLVPVSLF